MLILEFKYSCLIIIFKDKLRLYGLRLNYYLFFQFKIKFSYLQGKVLLPIDFGKVLPTYDFLAS